MKPIKYYINQNINEGLTKVQQDIVGHLMLQMFQNTKFTVEQMQQLLSNINIDYIQQLEHYINKVDQAHAMAYIVNDDEFISKQNHEKIISMLAEYFNKYVCNN